MSEHDGNDDGPPDFEIDDALAAWEAEFEDHAQSEAPPMPQQSSSGSANAPDADEDRETHVPTPSPPAPEKKPAQPTGRRPLYRPPTPEEIAEAGRRAAPPRPKTPERKGSADEAVEVPIEIDDIEEQDEQEADEPTRIAQVPEPPGPPPDGAPPDEATRMSPIPQDLMASLRELDDPASKEPATGRPPPQQPSRPTPAPVNLDLDDLLEDLEQDTRNIEVDPETGAPVSARTEPGRPSVPRPAAPEPRGYREPAADEPAGPHIPEPASPAQDDEDDDELFDPFFEDAETPPPQDRPQDLVALDDEAFDPFSDLLESDLGDTSGASGGAPPAASDDAQAASDPATAPPTPAAPAGPAPPPPKPAIPAPKPAIPAPKARIPAPKPKGRPPTPGVPRPPTPQQPPEPEPEPDAGDDQVTRIASADAIAPPEPEPDVGDDEVTRIASADAIAPPEPVIEADEPDEPVIEADEPDEPVIEADEPDEPVIEADEPEAMVGADVELTAEELAAIEAEGAAETPSPPPPATTPDLPDLPPPPPATRSATVEDAGAATARRTVRYRKPRPEHFPLVGRDADALRNRRELLEQLAEGAHGSKRAHLLVAAAELAEQLGVPDEARELYRSAREASPNDVVALRAVRRDAAARGEWTEVADLLEAEAKLPLAPGDKMLALTALAEVQLQQLGDAESAEKTARKALAGGRSSVATSLLLAEACFAQGREREAFDAVEKAAHAWDDPTGKAALLVEVGRAAEALGHHPRARKHYAAAAEADSDALDALLGAARTARAAGDVDQAVEALVRAAELTRGPAAEALLRHGAELLHLVGQRPAEAVSLLSNARGVLALQTRAAAAAAAGDATAGLEAVKAWAGASGGTERALALVTLAELHADGGDLDAADAALKDAALADAKLGTVRVVREVLARRAGDTSRLARAVDEGAGDSAPGGALVAAARLARDPSQNEAEREQLARAVGEGENPETADVLGLDAASAGRDDDATRSALRRQGERATPEHKPGPLLALADFAMRDGHPEVAEALLQEARDASPGDPLVLRPLARITDEVRAAASLWLEEASAAVDERAAFAATQAARVLLAGGEDAGAASALRRALDMQRTYLPALWALEPLARAEGDGETLFDLDERLAELGGDRREVAGRWVRAALLRAGDDPQAAAALLERAATEEPGDSIIYDLLQRLGGSDPAAQAALLEKSAQTAPEDLARTVRLQAAAAWEEAEQPASAAALYRKVLESHPDDPFARTFVDRAEISAGEHARVAERRFQLVKEAADDESRVAALEQLADLDMYERDEPASAVLSLESILEVAPGHLPSLRTLERYFMEQGRDEDLRAVQERFVEHLGDARDVTAHARLGARLHLAPADADGTAADELLVSAAGRAAPDLWLARHVEGAARSRDDLQLLAWAREQLAEQLTGPLERAGAWLRAAQAVRANDGDATAIERLEPAARAAPEHPTVAETLAQLKEAAGDATGAAEAYEAAAGAARMRRRIASLFYRAGVLRQEQLEDAEGALAAFEQAAAHDVAYLDLFDRMRGLLEERDDTTRLAELVRKRLEAGGDTPVLVELHLTRARLCERIGDRDGAKEALRNALALEPEKVDALKELANVCLEDEDWRGAAESLIRIARLRQEREELRWVFFTLGDIYDRHLPDAKRAEAAYRRVVKLVPEDMDALERLAELYRREEQYDQAVETYRDMVQREPDPDRNRDFRLRLSSVLEQRGDLRGAEAALEEARRHAPTDLKLLRGIADFYERQDARSALSMHLSRALGDLRQAIGTDPTDASAWYGLVEVLRWRGRDDAARCCASAAAGLGVNDVETAKLLDSHGGVPGLGAGATSEDLEELLAPQALTLSTRQVFRVASEAFDKVLPFDLKSLHAEKVGRDGAYRREAQQVAQWFGVSDVQVMVTSALPRVCVPVVGSPPTVLVGHELIKLDAPQRLFLLTRAVKLAVAGLAVTVRSQPDDLVAAVAGLIRAYDPNHVPAGVDPTRLDDMARRIHKAIPRRSRDELAALVMEMAGGQGFDPARLGSLASELADRVALLAVGTTPSALSALLSLAGGEVPGVDRPEARVAALRQVPEAWSLLSFSISDVHFDVRQQLGAERL